MLFVSLIRWWYSDGWRLRAQKMSSKLDGVIDYFSIDLLLKTLFQPFRQDGAGRVEGSLDVKMRAFADKMISRMLGAIIRLFILVFGLIAIALYVLYTLVVLVTWFFIPLAPLVGVVLAVLGVHF